MTNPSTVRIKVQMANYRLHRGRRYLSVGEVRLFLEQQCEWEVADVSRPNDNTRLLTRGALQQTDVGAD